MGKLRLLLPLSVLFAAAATLTAGWTLPLSVQRFKGKCDNILWVQ